ncbi:MAG: phosphoribosyl-ATP diphosphatase [Pseudomonadota bacterium]
MADYDVSDVLLNLVETIASRREASAGKSYTKSLLEAGPKRCARKFGEEALELVVAGVGEGDEAVTSEAADVIFHLLVLLEARGLAFDDVLRELASRTGQSGLEEKASRGAAVTQSTGPSA